MSEKPPDSDFQESDGPEESMEAEPAPPESAPDSVAESPLVREPEEDAPGTTPPRASSAAPATASTRKPPVSALDALKAPPSKTSIRIRATLILVLPILLVVLVAMGFLIRIEGESLFARALGALFNFGVTERSGNQSVSPQMEHTLQVYLNDTLPAEKKKLEEARGILDLPDKIAILEREGEIETQKTVLQGYLDYLDKMIQTITEKNCIRPSKEDAAKVKEEFSALLKQYDELKEKIQAKLAEGGPKREDVEIKSGGESPKGGDGSKPPGPPPDEAKTPPPEPSREETRASESEAKPAPETPHPVPEETKAPEPKDPEPVSEGRKPEPPSGEEPQPLPEEPQTPEPAPVPEEPRTPEPKEPQPAPEEPKSPEAPNPAPEDTKAPEPQPSPTPQALVPRDPWAGFLPGAWSRRHVFEEGENGKYWVEDQILIESKDGRHTIRVERWKDGERSDETITETILTADAIAPERVEEVEAGGNRHSCTVQKVRRGDRTITEWRLTDPAYAPWITLKEQEGDSVRTTSVFGEDHRSVGEREVLCFFFDRKEGEITKKIWLSEAVPGALVRLEEERPGAAPRLVVLVAWGDDPATRLDPVAPKAPAPTPAERLAEAESKIREATSLAKKVAALSKNWPSEEKQRAVVRQEAENALTLFHQALPVLEEAAGANRDPALAERAAKLKKVMGLLETWIGQLR